MTLSLVISGGQSGADQAALRAARAAGIPTGGWAPLGWQTEDGPAPWLAEYGLKEFPKPGYPPRTAANVRDSDATVWFGSIDSRGFRSTHDAAVKLDRPFLIVYSGLTRPSDVREWIAKHGIATVNVAGNRESVSPGIGFRAERFLSRVFAGLKPPSGPV